jgi:SAM-dependent methyltransferase
MHFQMIVCPDCSLCYASPIPTLSWFQSEYLDADFDATNESGYAAKSYARYLKKNIASLVAFDDALDIGTGDGAFLRELLNLGFTRVCGVEPSIAPTRVAKDDVAPLIQQGFFEPDMFPPNSFNLVSCFQTIEHLPDPSELFKAVYGMLRPGGCFLIAAHNYTALSAKFLRGNSPIFDIEHLQLLSPVSATAFYERAGFTDICINNLLNKYPLSYWLRLTALQEGRKKTLCRLLRVFGIEHYSLGLPVGNIAVMGFKPETSV